MPSRVVNERHVQAMDAGNTTGRMIGRIAAIIMAMLVTLATVFAFGSTTSAAFAASSSYADYATWNAVAEDINKQLAQGESDYRSGNTYQAATDFQNARWMNYDASNFSTVVNSTIGEDKQKALLQEFTDLETLAYQPNNADTTASKVDALSNDITATAQPSTRTAASPTRATTPNSAMHKPPKNANSSMPPKRTRPQAKATAPGATWPAR